MKSLEKNVNSTELVSVDIKGKVMVAINGQVVDITKHSKD